MIVADASVLVEALIGEGTTGDAARQRISDAPQLHAPHLVDLEVANAVRRLVASDRVPDDLAAHAITGLRQLPLTRYPHVPFLDRIWELRFAVTSYDAAYVALAEAVGVPLLTLDVRLGKASGARCPVEVIA